jgi:hypothetical protein
MDHDRIEAMKNTLRRCTTVAEVNAAARLLGKDVQEMSEHPTWAVYAIHIRNLAAYMRLTLGE